MGQMSHHREVKLHPGRRLLVVLILFTAGATYLSMFLVHQGLAKAALWATVLAFGATVVGAVASIWTLVITVRLSSNDDGPSAHAPHTNQATVKHSNKGGVNIVHTGKGDIKVSSNGDERAEN